MTRQINGTDPSVNKGTTALARRGRCSRCARGAGGERSFCHRSRRRGCSEHGAARRTRRTARGRLVGGERVAAIQADSERRLLISPRDDEEDDEVDVGDADDDDAARDGTANAGSSRRNAAGRSNTSRRILRKLHGPPGDLAVRTKTREGRVRNGLEAREQTRESWCTARSRARQPRARAVFTFAARRGPAKSGNRSGFLPPSLSLYLSFALSDCRRIRIAADPAHFPRVRIRASCDTRT